ncbi:GNAT family N-acetyltransferase [Anthocerotibacter panamensis]|uniref:GNAT family N-acetyltransferase n=1 Tax=Anthocerotibacter panamensis TaxID=2857077 RepID=UPI001C406000|nr:GNAT family N-acetyltransferase [Anthocerotibacter panamensis]
MSNNLQAGNPYEVRQAGLENQEAAFGLLQRFFEEEGFDTQQMHASLKVFLDHPSCAVFLVWQGAQPVGIATVNSSPSLEFGRYAEVEDLYVLPEMRSQGIGSALLRTAQAWCRAQECTQMAVVVTPESQSAHNLMSYYRAQGFQDTGRTILLYDLAASMP